jgi:hypothetical protein
VCAVCANSTICGTTAAHRSDRNKGPSPQARWARRGCSRGGGGQKKSMQGEGIEASMSCPTTCTAAWCTPAWYGRSRGGPTVGAQKEYDHRFVSGRRHHDHGCPRAVRGDRLASGWRVVDVATLCDRPSGEASSDQLAVANNPKNLTAGGTGEIAAPQRRFPTWISHSSPAILNGGRGVDGSLGLDRSRLDGSTRLSGCGGSRSRCWRRAARVHSRRAVLQNLRRRTRVRQHLHQREEGLPQGARVRVQRGRDLR